MTTVTADGFTRHLNHEYWTWASRFFLCALRQLWHGTPGKQAPWQKCPRTPSLALVKEIYQKNSGP